MLVIMPIKNLKTFLRSTHGSAFCSEPFDFFCSFPMTHERSDPCGASCLKISVVVDELELWHLQTRLPAGQLGKINARVRVRDLPCLQKDGPEFVHANCDGKRKAWEIMSDKRNFS